MNSEKEITADLLATEPATINDGIALCLLKARRYSELLLLETTSPYIVYCQTLALLSQGDEEPALALLQQARHFEYLPGLRIEGRLLIKKILEDCLNGGSRNVGRWFEHLERLSQNSLLQAERPFELWLAFPYLCLGERNHIESILERISQSDPYLPNLAHTWGILAYSWAFDLLESNRIDDAYRQFEIAIANFAYILVNESFWDNWISARQKAYEVEIDQENISQLKSRIKNHIGETISYKLSQHSNANARELSWQLGVVWELELEAARELKKAAKIKKSIVDQEEEIGFGPLFMRQRCLESEVRKLFPQSRTQEFDALSEALRKILSIDVMPKPEVDDEMSRLKRLFSSLGSCEMLRKQGQLKEALSVLDGRLLFAERGADIWSQQELQAMKNEMVTQVQLQIAENAIRDKSADLSTATDYWTRALESSSKWGGFAETKKDIIQAALGRAHALKERKKFDQAVEILESVYGILPEGQIAGRLAEILRNKAVNKANKAIDQKDLDSLELCLADMRRALELNPHVKQTRLDLCQILRTCAAWRFESDEADKPIEYLNEIVRVATEGLSIHTDDEQLIEFINEAQFARSIVLLNTFRANNRWASF